MAAAIDNPHSPKHRPLACLAQGWPFRQSPRAPCASPGSKRPSGSPRRPSSPPTCCGKTKWVTFELETFEWVKSDFVSETFETEKPEWVDSDLRTAAYRTPFSSRGVELSAFRSRPNFGADDTPRLVVGCKLNFAAVTRRSPSDKSRLYADHSPCTGKIRFSFFFFLFVRCHRHHGVSQSVTVSYFTVPLRAHPSAFSFNNLLNDERQVEA